MPDYEERPEQSTEGDLTIELKTWGYVNDVDDVTESSLNVVLLPSVSQLVGETTEGDVSITLKEMVSSQITETTEGDVSVTLKEMTSPQIADTTEGDVTVTIKEITHSDVVETTEADLEISIAIFELVSQITEANIEIMINEWSRSALHIPDESDFNWSEGWGSELQ